MTVNRVSSTRMNLKSLLLWAQGNPMVATQDLLSQVFCVVVLLCILCVSVCVQLLKMNHAKAAGRFFSISSVIHIHIHLIHSSISATGRQCSFLEGGFVYISLRSSSLRVEVFVKIAAKFRTYRVQSHTMHLGWSMQTFSSIRNVLRCTRINVYLQKRTG